MKLGNLIPLEEINFRNQKQFDDYAKKHTLRSTTKVTIAGKDTTAGQATKNPPSAIAKTGSPSQSSSKGSTKSKKFDADTDTKAFAKVLPKGFSETGGGTLDGVTSFADENGNNVYVSDPAVYNAKGNYAVSGYNDDDPSNTNYKSFTDKSEAIQYAKQLAIKLSGSTKLPEASYTNSGKLPSKASKLSATHARNVKSILNTAAGLSSGYAELDSSSGAITYNASKGDSPTYTLYMGSNDDYGKPDEFRVSLEPTYGEDPAKLGDKYDKTFKSADAAVAYMIGIAKKHKKELQMDDEA